METPLIHLVLFDRYDRVEISGSFEMFKKLLASLVFNHCATAADIPNADNPLATQIQSQKE